MSFRILAQNSAWDLDVINHYAFLGSIILDDTVQNLHIAGSTQ